MAAFGVERLRHQAAAMRQAGVVEGRREGVGGVAHGMQDRAVGEGGGETDMRCDAGQPGRVGDAAHRAADCRVRVAGEPLVHHQQEQQLRIGRALPLGIERVGQAVFQPAADRLEAADLAIVHEAPAAADKGVAVAAAGGAAGRGAHMRQEQARPHLPAQIAQVGVRPGRQDVAVKPRLRPLAVPGHPEAVAIGGRLGFAGMVALCDQRMAGRGDDVFQENRLAEIGGPAAHQACRARRLVRSASSRTMALAVVSNMKGKSAWTSAAPPAANSREANQPANAMWSR